MLNLEELSILVFFGFGVDVSQDVDVREVNPEPAEQSRHPAVKQR